MSQDRFGLGVVVVEDKIYAIGGYGVDGYMNTNECYDPKTDTWVALKPMPTSRCSFAIVAHQGKIYCMGGAVDSFITSGFTVQIVCGTNEVYDTATNSWSTKALMPFNRTQLQAHVVADKIFVIDGTAGMTGELYQYDPATDSWTKKTSLPTSNYGLVSAVIDDKIIVTGGINSAINDVMIYDPKTDMWSRGTSGPYTPISDSAGTTTGHYAPQKIYVIGYSPSDRAVINLVYDPINDSWSTAKSMPTVRVAFGVAVVEDVLYVIGGATLVEPGVATRPLSINEQYVPIGYNSQGYPDTQPSDTVPSEQKPSGFSLNSFTTAAVVLVLAVVFVVGGLFFYFKKRGRTISREMQNVDVSI